MKEAGREEDIKDGFVWGWLTTDASVLGSTVKANITSLFQAALYKAADRRG